MSRTTVADIAASPSESPAMKTHRRRIGHDGHAGLPTAPRRLPSWLSVFLRCGHTVRLAEAACLWGLWHGCPFVQGPSYLPGWQYPSWPGLTPPRRLAAIFTRLPPRVIDIPWVTLCVPLRPGKNSFVLMRGVRSPVRSCGRRAGRLHMPTNLGVIYLFVVFIDFFTYLFTE